MRARPSWPGRRIGFTADKREGDDIEAINRLFAPEFRNRLDAIISFGHLPQEVVAKVVDKFVLQLEAQLADRNVTIELTDEARDWLVEHGYDEPMGARPMARLIQSTIKTPLADEVLFGRLKNGGAVRVDRQRTRTARRALGFEFPEGRVMPKPEKDVAEAKKAREKRARCGPQGRARRARWPRARRVLPVAEGPTGGSGGGKPGGKPAVRTVPKVPLVRS